MCVCFSDRCSREIRTNAITMSTDSFKYNWDQLPIDKKAEYVIKAALKLRTLEPLRSSWEARASSGPLPAFMVFTQVRSLTRAQTCYATI